MPIMVVKINLLSPMEKKLMFVKLKGSSHWPTKLLKGWRLVPMAKFGTIKIEVLLFWCNITEKVNESAQYSYVQHKELYGQPKT